MLTVFILLGGAVLLQQCTAYKLAGVQNNLVNRIESQKYESAEQLLIRNWESDIYGYKDRVLYNLELGTVRHFAGDYQGSFEAFKDAEQFIDDLYTKSISRAFRSFIVNDNVLAYDGEDYEDIYLNLFNTLNFLHQNNLESALVESRRIAYKLEQLDIRHEGLVSALSKADTTEFDKWETGKANVESSALGHFLSGLLFSKSGKPDDARIESEKVIKSLKKQEINFNNIFSFPDTLIQRINQPETYNTLLITFSGKSPEKIQYDTRIYLDEYDLYLKFSLPKLRMRPTQVRSVRASVNEHAPKSVYLIEEMDRIAAEVYKVKKPIIYARTVVRALIKALSTQSFASTNGNENEEDDDKNKTLGKALNILGKLGQEFTEKADLRGWQTMPGKAYVQLLQLPKGTHAITIEYVGPYGTIHEEVKNIEITENNTTLNVVESVYWN